jgi:hypothetical protein
MKKAYNWWEDPKNTEEVQRISWWEHSENKTFIQFPLSIINDHGYFVVASNSETKQLIGNIGGSSAQGDTLKGAVDQYFKLIKFHHEFLNEKMLSYQRWVPFRKGPWGKIGGNWFAIFGINMHFRYGKGMKGGFYIPYTKLNISLHNNWNAYNRWKSKNKHEKVSNNTKPS